MILFLFGVLLFTLFLAATAALKQSRATDTLLTAIALAALALTAVGGASW